MFGFNNNSQLRRHVNPDDVPRLLEIESQCFSAPWSDDEFWAALTASGVYTTVIEMRSVVVGYLMVDRDDYGEAEVINLAVTPSHRRMGIASRLIQLEMPFLIAHATEYVFARVSESNLPLQLCLQSLGWRCDAIERGISGVQAGRPINESNQTDDVYRFSMTATRYHQRHTAGTTES